MKRTQWPTPDQIGTYLCSHGWRFDRPMKQPGVVYVYHQPADDGTPVELFVPHFKPQIDDVNDYATSILAVVETVEALEGRDREAVFADMLATTPAQGLRKPPVPTT